MMTIFLRTYNYLKNVCVKFQSSAAVNDKNTLSEKNTSRHSTKVQKNPKTKFIAPKGIAYHTLT